MAEYPFANIANASSSTELPLFKEWAWNFEEDHFIYDENGKHILLEGNEALKVWCYKALRTERYMYQAYSRNYGIELYPFMAKVMLSMLKMYELTIRHSIIMRFNSDFLCPTLIACGSYRQAKVLLTENFDATAQ